MDNKSIMIFCLLILLFVGINSIYASDINSTQKITSTTDSFIDTASIEKNDLSVSTNNNLLKQTENNKTNNILNDNNEKLGATEYTFQDLENKINATSEGSELNLTSDDIYKNTNSYSADGIKITKNITINGNGATIDGNNLGRIFNITSDHVILKNITFINGYADRGSAVYANTKITIYDCKFENNNASIHGGAIDGGNHVIIDVYNSIFINNICIENGGAINGQTIHIYNSRFMKNSARNGGAINGLVFVSVDNSTFTDNIATGDGGAVAGVMSVTSTNSNYTNNTANLYGGALYGYLSVAASNSIFENNTVKTHDGGAVRGGTVQIDKSKFVKNTAEEHGGAVYGQNSVTILNSNFADNTAKNGGAIGGNKVNVDRSNILNNTAEEYGGAINSDNIDIKNSLIMGNKAKNGSAIYVSGAGNSKVVVNDSVLYNNTASEGFDVDTNKDSSQINSDLNNNWWGNDESNYLIKPNVSPVFNLNNWIFLGIKTDKPSISINESENITLSLSELANETGDLNMSHNLTFVNFDLKATGGTIDKNNLNMSSGKGKVVYTATNSGNNALLGKFNDYSFKFGINILNPSFIIASNMTRGWNSGLDYEARLVDENNTGIANTEITFTINGKEYNSTTNNEGYARLNVPLAVGNYTVIITNPLTGNNTTTKLNIVKRLIENKDVVMKYDDGSKYVVKAIGDDGKPISGAMVKIILNGITYDVKTDSEGYAKLPITVAPNKYTISASYKGDTVKNKVVVNSLFPSKWKVKYTQKSLKKHKGVLIYYKLGKFFKGKTIKLKFKGKTYTCKVNKKGNILLKIPEKVVKTLKNGKKYKYTLMYKLDQKNRYYKVYKNYLYFYS